MTGPDFAELPAATAIARAGEWSGAYDVVTLTFDDRLLRRKRLETVHQETFTLNLPEITPVDHGDAFVLADGRRIEVIAAEEALLEITGTQLTAVAWHLGSRHAACQTEADRLLIRPDPALSGMLALFGVTVRPVSEPFVPSGGTHGPDHDHHGHAGHPATPAKSPTILSRTGRTAPPDPDPLPEGGPFGDGS